MTKTELADAIAASTGLSKNQAGDVLNSILDQATVALSKGERVALPGLGSFSLSERAARTGRNPQTGQTMTIAASKTVRFSPAAALKKAVN